MAITGRIETVFDVREAMESAAADLRSLAAKLGDIVGVPEGYRIERREEFDRLHGTELRAVEFVVTEPADRGRRVVTASARYEEPRPARGDGRPADPGGWFVEPGGSTSACEPEEARARAAALMMAAVEVERRNAG